MKSLFAGAAAAALVLTPMSASVAAAQAAETNALTLAAGTPITLAVAQEVNSSTNDAGETFRLTVLNDVKVGDKIVIPRGTPATGEITWRTGKGAFGKSGKLEFSLRYIDLNNQAIPVTGDYRQEGEGNTIATGVGIIAVGVFAGFITGKRARVPMGRELMSQTAAAVPFNADGSLASSYSGSTALAAAEGKTPLGQCKAKANALPAKKQKEALKDCFSKRME